MRTFKQYLQEKQNDQQDITYTHYSHSPNLSVLSGSKSGTGIRGKEQERVQNATDKRIQSRVYFYPPSIGGDLPKPEAGLGQHVYQTKLSNIHDATKQSPESLKIAATAKKHVESGEERNNAYERAVLDHGFDGYKISDMAIVLNKDVPVDYMGTHHNKTFGIAPKASTKEQQKSLLTSPINSEGKHSSSSLSNEQSMFYMKNQKTLKAAAPSLNLEFGRLSVHHSDLGNLKSELSKHDSHPL